MDRLDDIKAAVIAVVGALTGFWGWMGWLVVCWLVCMMLDYVTRTMAACAKGDWSSKLAREGILHKLGMVFVVCATGVADLVLGVVIHNLIPSIHYPGAVCPIVLCWYIVTELGSVAENAVDMGADVPEWLRKLLKVTKDQIDKTGGEDNDGQ